MTNRRWWVERYLKNNFGSHQSKTIFPLEYFRQSVVEHETRDAGTTGATWRWR